MSAKKHTKAASSDESVQPEKSPGTPAFDLSSQRTTEVFEAEDVVFFRQGPSAQIQAIPRHEAKTRFVEVTKSESSFEDHKNVERHELADGSKVLIKGDTITVTPADGDPATGGPSLNVHNADTQG